MSLSAFRLKFAALLAALALVACGGKGSSAPAPDNVRLDPGDGQVTVTWDAVPGVEYWLAYAAADKVSTDSGTPHIWASMSGVSSPFVLTGLSNGTTYSFSLNGRIDGGPGGDGSASVSTVPRPGGGSWSAGSATDGTSTTPTLGSQALRAVAYSLVSTTSGTTTTSTSTYLAVGDAGAMYQSADGKSWRAITASSKPGVNLNAAIYTLNQYLVAGAGGALYSSTDLATWNAVTSGTGNSLNALASNGARVVAVGDAGTIVYSDNGSTWTAASTVPSSANLYGVAYSASGVWLAVGANGTLLTSSDASSWTQQTSNTTATLRGVASTQLRSVIARTPGVYSHAIVGDAGTVLTGSSADITQWTAANVDASVNLAAVVGSASQFLAVGSGGRVFTSADNATWAAPSTSPNTVTNPAASMAGLVFAQAQYVAVGAGGASSNSH